MTRKTHREVKQPQISAARLADYMAASEQTRRSIARSCKYQPIARVVQYNDGHGIVSDWLVSGKGDIDLLHAKLERLRSKLPNDQFDAEVIEHNCDYVSNFIKIVPELDLPVAELSASTKQPPLLLNGTRVSLQPHLMLRRMTRSNKLKLGAVMLRYSKGKALAEQVAEYQASLLHAFLGQERFAELGEAEKSLCIVLDARHGVHFEAPGKATYLFKEMSAVCENLAERWPAITPPPGAIF